MQKNNKIVHSSVTNTEHKLDKTLPHSGSIWQNYHVYETNLLLRILLFSGNFTVQFHPN